MTSWVTLERLEAALGKPASPSSDFDLNSDVTLPEGRVLRPAAVLVPILQRGADLSLVLTKRAAALRNHPGQVAFPGGKQDEGDADLWATALREAQEEIGLSPSNAEPLGILPTHETVTSFAVAPHVALITDPGPWRIDPGEVDEVFEVPLDHVLNVDRFMIEGRIWQGRMRRYFVLPYGPYYIWGATARILRGLAERVAG